MYTIRFPRLLQYLYPKALFRGPRKDLRTIYITFDDGPIPDITPWVLDQLATYNARATFFCIGDNVRKHPAIFQSILEPGIHSVGNHTFHHLNHFKTPTNLYEQDIVSCCKWVNSTLFRPPYGKLSPRMHHRLKQQGYTTVFWDVLSGDFDTNISGETCWKHLKKNLQDGSIVVLHDSIKAAPRMQYVLPKLLQHCVDEGIQTLPIPYSLFE